MENTELRVLIAEDNEADYELMLHGLRRSGISVNARRVASKDALVTTLTSFGPDIVLVDHALPGSSGLEILHLVQRERPLLPVLIVTGSIDEETAADYIKAGAADYVIKQRLHRLGPAVQRALTLKAELTSPGVSPRPSRCAVFVATLPSWRSLRFVFCCVCWLSLLPAPGSPAICWPS